MLVRTLPALFAITFITNCNAANILPNGSCLIPPGVTPTSTSLANITSPNGNYKLVIGASKDLSILRSNGSVRATLADTGGGISACMQSDGNFRYINGPGATRFSTGTFSGTANRLVIYDNGDLTVELPNSGATPRTVFWSLGPDDGTYRALEFISPPGVPPSTVPSVSFPSSITTHQ